MRKSKMRVEKSRRTQFLIDKVMSQVSRILPMEEIGIHLKKVDKEHFEVKLNTVKSRVQAMAVARDRDVSKAINRAKDKFLRVFSDHKDQRLSSRRKRPKKNQDLGKVG